MKHKPGQSPLWAYINQTQITKETIKDLTNFKSGGVNFKIALWDPRVNGVRYLKTLIYNLWVNLTSANLILRIYYWQAFYYKRDIELENVNASK